MQNQNFKWYHYLASGLIITFLVLFHLIWIFGPLVYVYVDYRDYESLANVKATYSSSTTHENSSAEKSAKAYEHIFTLSHPQTNELIEYVEISEKPIPDYQTINLMHVQKRDTFVKQEKLWFFVSKTQYFILSAAGASWAFFMLKFWGPFRKAELPLKRNKTSLRNKRGSKSA